MTGDIFIPIIFLFFYIRIGGVKSFSAKLCLLLLKRAWANQSLKGFQ